MSPKLPPAIAAKRPARPSFPLVLQGVVYVATPDPDGPGYLMRRYVPPSDGAE